MERDSKRKSDTARTLERSIAMGITHFQVSIHDNPCPACAPYQGKVFSVNGDPNFPPLLAVPPFCNGCRHVLLPYVERPGREAQHEAIKAISNSKDPIAGGAAGYDAAIAQARATDRSGRRPVPPQLPKQSISLSSPPQHDTFKSTPARSKLGCLKAAAITFTALFLFMVTLAILAPTPDPESGHTPVSEPGESHQGQDDLIEPSTRLPEAYQAPKTRIRIASDGSSPMLPEPTIRDVEEVGRVPADTEIEVVEWVDHKQGKALTRYFKVSHGGKEGWINQYFTDGFLYTESGEGAMKEEIPGMKGGLRLAPVTEEDELRAKAIKAQFSSWDGSHPAVTRAIKDTMKNPDSFSHVESTFREVNDYILVMCKYEGTNGFGAVVREIVGVKISIDGAFLGFEK